MEKHQIDNTSEFHEVELDYNSQRIKLQNEMTKIIEGINLFPEDKILPLLLAIAKINLKILKIIENENKSKL